MKHDRCGEQENAVKKTLSRKRCRARKRARGRSVTSTPAPGYGFLHDVLELAGGTDVPGTSTATSSIDEVIEQFDVTREQITAVLEFVAQSLRADPVPAGAHPL
ncbi:MAG: hypothetical protein GEU82_05440 [Luteitalea sp.]|nr:hypothetical protein [Luteitalea sp.]